MPFPSVGGAPLSLAVPATWSSGTSYAKGDLAIRGNALFIASQAHTNQDPFTDCATVLAGTYWSFFSLRGAVSVTNDTAETITATSLALAPTPDEATVYCPAGVLNFMVSGQWKLSGSSIAASSAELQVDDTVVTGPVANNGTNGTAATLGATGTFWGVFVSIGTTVTGMLSIAASTSSDAPAPVLPHSTSGNPNVTSQGIYVGVGVHKVNLKYAAGNGTTTVNVRYRRLKIWGE